jgi:predicted nucleic acid-binding Zn ribbon protein
MSLLLIGKTQCPICGQVIQERESVVSFPAFVWNEADPLAVFNDASLHKVCFLTHALREQAESAVAEMSAKVGPGRRRCVVCAREITNPDDYIFVPRLSAESSGPLGRFNFTHLHRSHARQWRDLGELLAILKSLDRSGVWKGSALQLLIQDFESAAAGAR